MDITTIIGSAAVGALVSSLITIIGQWRERKSRRDELLLTKAIEMAHTRFEHFVELTKDLKANVKHTPEIYLAWKYHHSLKALIETGHLDEYMKQELRASGVTAEQLREK